MKNGANRARTSASSTGGGNDERGVHQLERNWQGYSVEGVDAVI